MENRRPPHPANLAPDAAGKILRFWFEEAGAKNWFRGGPAFDAEIRTRFADAHNAAADRLLDRWRNDGDSALALILLLDQFSRNIFRNDRRAFAQDAYARDVAAEAIDKGFDRVGPEERRAFFYLPFMHSEELQDQERSVRLFEATLAHSSNMRFAREHAAIIRRFGRFPHRNEILGRTSTPEETLFLRDGGFKG